MHPSPHNFTNSPVQEVLCSCTFESEEPLILRILAPYPGWISIKQDLKDLLKSLCDPVIVTGCTLQYTDIFHPVTLDTVSGPHFLGFSEYSGIKSRIIGRKGDDLIISSPIPKSDILIRHKNGGHRGQGCTLIFTVVNRSTSFSIDQALQWFDSAHDEIHILFDLCIPPEMSHSLREKEE